MYTPECMALVAQLEQLQAGALAGSIRLGLEHQLYLVLRLRLLLLHPTAAKY